MLYEKKVWKIKYCKIVGKLIKGIIRNVCSFDHVLDPSEVNHRRFDLIHDETRADGTDEEHDVDHWRAADTALHASVILITPRRQTVSRVDTSDKHLSPTYGLVFVWVLWDAKTNKLNIRQSSVSTRAASEDGESLGWPLNRDWSCISCILWIGLKIEVSQLAVVIIIV